MTNDDLPVSLSARPERVALEKRARRTALMRNSGPYTVKSRADGSLAVYPAWGQFPEWSLEDGGGPGLLSRMSLARHIERFLNGSEAPVGAPGSGTETGTNKPCPRCGGRRRVDDRSAGRVYPGTGAAFRQKPCPDCADGTRDEGR
jgi:hypothetical protein